MKKSHIDLVITKSETKYPHYGLCSGVSGICMCTSVCLIVVCMLCVWYVCCVCGMCAVYVVCMLCVCVCVCVCDMCVECEFVCGMVVCV